MENSYILSDTSNLTDPVDKAIKKFELHPSILEIRKRVTGPSFSFDTVTLPDLELEIRKLNPNKETARYSVPTKSLIENVDTCAPVLHPIINNVLQDFLFPDKLKLADLGPLSKGNEKTMKKNYRPISLLPAVSKIFERIMETQLGSFVNEKLFKYMSRFRKGYNTQYALMALLEKWKQSLDNHGYAGAVIMDLSKAFDTVNHELLIAKLHAYGLTKPVLKLLYSYLRNRWHRTKINTSFSTRKELLTGVPQGSILAALLFNIYLILDMTDVCNYADDTGLHACNKGVPCLLTTLEHDTALAIEWFEINYMKLNKDKFHLLIVGHKYENLWVDVGCNSN